MARWTARYDRLARDNACRDHDLRGPEIRDPAELLAHAYEQARKLGVTLRVKPKSAISPGTGMAPSRKLVLLPHDWDSTSTANKAAMLLHELVHIRQWRRYALFGARWVTSPRFRVAVEVQAYRESICALAMMGHTRRSLAAYAKKRAESFAGSYRTKRVRVDIERYLLDSLDETLLGLGA